MPDTPDWVPKVVNALQRGSDAYREAAEIIMAAMAADRTLTQTDVAALIGHKPPWVCRLLKWHHLGCPPGGVFGPESAARRANNSASNFDDCHNWPVFDNVQLTEREANQLADAARESTRQFIRTVRALTREGMSLAYKWMPGDKRRDMLEKLADELDDSMAASGRALDEVRAALPFAPEMSPEDDLPEEEEDSILSEGQEANIPF